MNNEKTLGDYLNGDAHNISIEQALEEHYSHLFDTLEFFNLLYDAFDFFEDNQDNYLDIKNTFKQINLEGERLWVFLYYLVETIKHYHQSPNEKYLLFTEAASKSFEYINKLLINLTKELYPGEELEIIEQPQNSKLTTPLSIQEKTDNDSSEVQEIVGTNSTLRQKILVIKYLQQFKLLNLTTIHQDQTKQAQILSFLMGQASANTTRVALGEDISVLKTKTNLEAAQKLFEPLKDAFPQIMAKIETDIKNLKKK